MRQNFEMDRFIEITFKLKYFDLADRFREHIGYVKSTNLTQLTGNHFNLPEHALSNMKVTVLEKCKENNLTYWKIRES